MGVNFYSPVMRVEKVPNLSYAVVESLISSSAFKILLHL